MLVDMQTKSRKLHARVLVSFDIRNFQILGMA